MASVIILWTICAGLAYMIAKDRAPSKAPIAAVLGFALGPIGVAVAFMLKEDA